MNEKYRVLIVDDDKASLKIYEEVLKKAPEFHVEEAKRGKGAIRKIKKSLTPPFSLENLSLDVRASIGAVLFPLHGKDFDTLMQRADVAMYAAKQDNTGYVLYSEELDKHSPHRLTLTGELREAIEQDELLLYYQPKILSDSNQLYAVEALVRWQHQKHGFMEPDSFIPLAERTGLIQDLTIWVLKGALKQCANWQKAIY